MNFKRLIAFHRWKEVTKLEREALTVCFLNSLKWQFTIYWGGD